MIFLQKMRGISEMHLSVQTIRNLQKGIHETTEYLEAFLRNLLLNEKNELHNRNLHISGLLNEEKKVDIGDSKVDIENKKVDIESVLSEKGSNFSVKKRRFIFIDSFCECYPNSWPQEMREV